jgi:hypothetical protein
MPIPWSAVGPWQGWRARSGLFAVFFLLNVALAWPTLRWPMVYDDLHLIRPLEAHELLGAFHGDWDPDRIETEGFRPLTTVFNDLRALVFGENVVAHRLFVIGLHALYLALLVSLATRVPGTSPRAALAGGLLALCSHLSVYHYVWLADGVHILQGLAFVGAAHLLLSALEGGRNAPLVLSGALVVAGALVREDTLVVVPVLVLLGLPGTKLGDARLTRLAYYGLGLGAAALALMGLRGLMVPAAPPAAVYPGGLLHQLLRVLNPVGNDAFDPLSRVLSLGGWAVVLGIATILVLRRREARWEAPALWLLCAALACSAASEFLRDNLLFFPLAFLSLSVATALDEAARLAPRRAALYAACAAWLVLGGVYTSRFLAENFDPDSTIALSWNGQFIYGWARKARIPATRRAEVARHMAALGIHSRRELRRRLGDLERESLLAGRRRPTQEGEAFYPLAALSREEF